MAENVSEIILQGTGTKSPEQKSIEQIKVFNEAMTRYSQDNFKEAILLFDMARELDPKSKTGKDAVHFADAVKSEVEDINKLIAKGSTTEPVLKITKRLPAEIVSRYPVLTGRMGTVSSRRNKPDTISDVMFGK